jgi:hypothetical protein
MCPQAPRLSSEYSHKVGLQTVITEKPLQIGLVMHLAMRGMLQWAEFTVGFRVERGRVTGRPRCGPSSCSVVDKGSSLWAFVLQCKGRRVETVGHFASLVQRVWRRHRAKGSVCAFAPTANTQSGSCKASSTLKGLIEKTKE